MTPLSEMIPAMPDADLKTLRANAERLLGRGTAGQIASANEILPLIEAEFAARIAAKPPAKKRAPAKKKVVVADGAEPVVKAAPKKRAPAKKKVAAAAEATAS
ncbi:hypothetical protein [uncultured Brevundimonas sp.]|uniref:hypothetical protein n=1 Tax=uncultured Brevundimonas sp. TaxID=213418 RepID=UPI0030ED13AA